MSDCLPEIQKKERRSTAVRVPAPEMPEKWVQTADFDALM